MDSSLPRDRREIDLLCRTLYGVAEALRDSAGELVPAELASAGDPIGRLDGLAERVEECRVCLGLLRAEVNGAR
jgi:hypothetical protein